ncbi:hypothetical protein GCM10027610_029480 [Dactylosporangium cerinum]
MTTAATAPAIQGQLLRRRAGSCGWSSGWVGSGEVGWDMTALRGGKGARGDVRAVRRARWPTNVSGGAVSPTQAAGDLRVVDHAPAGEQHGGEAGRRMHRALPFHPALDSPVILTHYFDRQSVVCVAFRG